MIYLVATKQFVVSLDEWKFYDTRDVGDAPRKYPFYVTDDKWSGSVIPKHTSQIELNGLNIVLHRNEWSLGNCYAEVHTNDAIINAAIQPKEVLMGGGNISKRLGAFYQFKVDGRVVEGEVDYGREWGDVRFAYLPGLWTQQCQDMRKNKLSYGLRNKQYHVTFKGKRLGGTCYAMMLGLWAILLGDDLSFDSVVMLDGATSDELIVNRFIHTSNPYILKVMTLTK